MGGRGDTFESQLSLRLAIVMTGMKVDLLKSIRTQNQYLGWRQYFRRTQLLQISTTVSGKKNTARTLNPPLHHSVRAHSTIMSFVGG